MSPLFRDELYVALSPDRVAMVRVGRGMRPEIVSRHVVACGATLPDEMPWVKALESLETGLRAMEGDKIDATIVLSNHFVRYALVPWSDQISDRNEEQAFIRHCFAKTYGEDAQHWALRMSPSGYGETQVASAIDQSLLDALERIVTVRGLRLVSAQPYFMTAFNQWRHQLQDSVAWFVVSEPGRLCVSQLQQGLWSSMRTVKVGDDWQPALKKLLEREFLVSESGKERGTVYLFAPELDPETVLPGWTVHQIRVTPDAAPFTEINFAMTMRE